MTTLASQFPEKVFSAMRVDPNEFAEQLRLAAAVLWYEQGKISQEVAANISGVTRTDFLLALARMGQNSFVVDFDDLDRELSRG